MPASVPDCKCGSLLLVEHLARPKCPSKALTEELLVAWLWFRFVTVSKPTRQSKGRKEASPAPGELFIISIQWSVAQTWSCHVVRKLIHCLPAIDWLRSLAEICAGHSWASRARALPKPRDAKIAMSSESKSYSDNVDACFRSYRLQYTMWYVAIQRTCKKNSWRSPWSTHGELGGCCCPASLLTFQWQHLIQFGSIDLYLFGLELCCLTHVGIREFEVSSIYFDVPVISISSFGVTSENWTLH